MLNKQYFNPINESLIVKKNLDNIDKRVIELVIDKRFKELKEFLLSESYIDQINSKSILLIKKILTKFLLKIMNRNILNKILI